MRGPSPKDKADQASTVDDGPVFPFPADATGDTTVDGLTANLVGIPDLPIADHNNLYAELHDGLLAELNADPPDAHDPS